MTSDDKKFNNHEFIYYEKEFCSYLIDTDSSASVQEVVHIPATTSHC